MFIIHKILNKLFPDKKTDPVKKIEYTGDIPMTQEKFNEWLKTKLFKENDNK